MIRSLPFLILSIISYVTAITFRIRLQSGAVQRFEFDDEKSLASLKESLVSQGLITSNDTVICRSENLNFANNGSLSIKELHLTNGEMLSVKLAESREVLFINKKNISNVNSSVSVSNTKYSTSTVKMSPPKKKSISDIGKWRSSLMKITRQKPPSNITVRVTPSSSRILEKLSSGGISLLLGNYAIDNDKNQQVIVVGCCEVKQGIPSCFPDPNNIEILQNLKNILLGLKLEVVGCSISLGNEATWSSSHVKISSQLRNLFVKDSNNTFITLSAIKNAPPSASPTKKINGKSQKGVSSTTTTTSRSLSLEGYMLSEQAIALYQQGLITCNDSDHSDDNNDSILHLTHPVLILSDETSIIDPLLLAVPLPIISSDKKKKSNTYSRSKDNTSSNPPPVSLEHTFPSPHDLQDPLSFKQATSYLKRLFEKEKLASGGTVELKQRLRDPHLLLFLHTMLDSTTIRALCQSLHDDNDNDSNRRLSGQLTMALNMMMLSLCAAEEENDNNSSTEDVDSSE